MPQQTKEADDAKGSLSCEATAESRPRPSGADVQAQGLAARSRAPSWKTWDVIARASAAFAAGGLLAMPVSAVLAWLEPVPALWAQSAAHLVSLVVTIFLRTLTMTLVLAIFLGAIHWARNWASAPLPRRRRRTAALACSLLAFLLVLSWLQPALDRITQATRLFEAFSRPLALPLTPEVLTSIVPTSILGALAANHMAQIIFSGTTLGLAIGSLADAAAPLAAGVDAALLALRRLLRFLATASPVACFALSAALVLQLSAR